MLGKHPNGNVLVIVIKDWIEPEDQGWRNLEPVKMVVVEAGRIDVPSVC